MGVPDHGKKRTHDITVIKRTTAATLRNNVPEGRKILYVWDKACIDYRKWSNLKATAGTYFITREKSNSAVMKASGNLIDHTDPRNKGIVSEYLVSPSYGEVLRRITYTDPADGTTYVYLTNEIKIPAHLMVIIYEQRWDIEKVFHQLKSKMEERKSWASSETAKRHHAIFECLAHNLCLLMEFEMNRRGLRDAVEEKKNKGREGSRLNRQGEVMEKATNFIGKAIHRATQRTVRFIRWLQAALYHQGSLNEAIAMLKRVWCPKKIINFSTPISSMSLKSTATSLVSVTSWLPQCAPMGRARRSGSSAWSGPGWDCPNAPGNCGCCERGTRAR
ncbi:MAG: transposase [Akkermansiaceae bacterium]